MTGPKSFNCPIGTQLGEYEELAVVNFGSVECEIPKMYRQIPAVPTL